MKYWLTPGLETYHHHHHHYYSTDEWTCTVEGAIPVGTCSKLFRLDTGLFSFAKIFSIDRRKLFPFELTREQDKSRVSKFCSVREEARFPVSLCVKPRRVNRNRSKQASTKESQILKSVWTSRHSVTMGFSRRDVNIRGAFFSLPSPIYRSPLLPKKLLSSSTLVCQESEISKFSKVEWIGGGLAIRARLGHDRWVHRIHVCKRG